MNMDMRIGAIKLWAVKLVLVKKVIMKTAAVINLELGVAPSRQQLQHTLITTQRWPVSIA